MKNAPVLSFLAFLLCSVLAPAWADAAAAASGARFPDFSQATWGCGLNLTVEQTERLRDLQGAFLNETRGARERLKREEAEVRRLWDRKNPDQGKINAAQEEIGALHSEIREKAERYRMEAGKSLTLEQQAQLGKFPRGQEGDVFPYGMRGELAAGRRAGTGYGSCPRL